MSMPSCTSSDAKVIGTEETGSEIIDNTTHNLTKAIVYIKADSTNIVKAIIEDDILKPYTVGDSVYMFHGTGKWYVTDNPFNDSGELLRGYIKGRIHSFLLNNNN